MLEQFQLNSQALSSFITHIPQPAHLHRVSSGELIQANDLGVAFVASHQLNQILSADLNHAVNSFGLDPESNLSALMNTQLLLTGQAVTEHQCIVLDKQGKIGFYSIVKLPVQDHDDVEQIAAILTVYFKSERVITPVEIYQYYKLLNDRHKQDRKQAVQRLLAHFNILDCFVELLTEKELLCLLHMRIDTNHKSLASKLFVSPRTIESHVSHLLRKSKQHDLSAILACLRRD